MSGRGAGRWLGIAVAGAAVAGVAVAWPVAAHAGEDGAGDGPGSPVAEPYRLHVELDPLPFVLGGYGGQIGVRAPRWPHLRVALASFSLDVPDAVAQLGGNDGFHIRVRPSVAVYGLYCPLGRRSGWVMGGSVRWLRLRYTREGSAEEARPGQLSIQGILGYHWHPAAAGFYLQPWLGVARTLASTADARVAGRTYDDLPVQLFATVSLGWDLEID